MTAGTGTILYPASPEKPQPPRRPTHAEYMISTMRSPKVQLPTSELLWGFVQTGALTVNDVRRIQETWYETHSFPSFYVMPP